MSQSLTRFVLFAMLALNSCTSAPETAQDKPLSDDAIIKLADRMRAQGDITMAADFYQRALERSPDNLQAYLGLAALHEQVGQPEQAGKYYLQAIQHDGSNVAVRRGYARLLMTQGQYTAAAEQYQAALQKDPADIRSMNGLGVAYDQLGKNDNAQELYRQVESLDAGNMTARSNLGLSMIAAGDPHAAVKLLEPAAESLKASPSLRQNLALAYIMTGQDAAAQKLLRRDLGVAEAEKVMKQLRGQNKAWAQRKLAPMPEAETAGAVLTSPPTESVAPMPVPQSPVQKSSERVAEGQPDGIVILRNADGRAMQRQNKIDGPVSSTEVLSLNPFGDSSGSKPEPAPQPDTKPVSPSMSSDIGVVIGSYPTGAMASVRSAMIREKYAGYLPEHPIVNVTPERAKDGTPRFVINVFGFSSPEAAKDFCAFMKKRSYACTPKKTH